MGLELRVLGSLEVRADGVVVGLPGRKQRRLLAALALANGRSCSVDALVEAVWGQAPPPSARKLLQLYVSQLRKQLGPAAVVTEGSRYGLRLGHDVIDAERFEQLATEASAALEAENASLAASLAERALALWRGPAYADVMYDEFALVETERLEELRLRVLEDRLDARIRLGNHEEVMPEVLALLGEHPLRERAQGLAMLALYRAGRQSEALARYADFRRHLDEELGLEPGPWLRELQQQILRQDQDLAPATPTTRAAPLPLALQPIVGRTRELALLREVIARRDARLLVLTGAGGSGKTRLALEAAREAAGSFANGAAIVELAPLRDPDAVVTTIAQSLGVAEIPGEPPIHTLANAVRDRELLLVLDNAEHVRAAAPSYAELVARAPRLIVLVTSRSVLHVSGEQVFPVEPLAEDDALELLRQRARQLAPSSEPSAESETELRLICRRLDGLPLAIELAAARLRTLTPRLLMERLGERLALLTSGPRDLPARQQTLRQTIDWSVGLLSDGERRVFARLAVFPAGATLEAAEAVCGANLDTLTALVDGNVVRRTDTGGEPRFGLLETIREYALELLGDDRRATELALARHLLTLVEEAYATYTEDPGWLARFDAELDNLRLALDVAAATDPGLELKLAGGLWRFWWTRGYLDEGLARIEGALSRAGGTSPELAKASRGAAGIAWSRGDLELAETRAAETLALAREIDSPMDEVGAHTILGILANQRKDFETARRHHEQSLAIKERLGLEPAVEKLNLGIVAMDSGDNQTAVALYEDALAIHRRSGNPSGIGFATLNRGLAQHRLGRAPQAEESFQEARVAFVEVGFRAHAAHALQGLAACAASSGRSEEAAVLLGQAAAELGELVYSEEDFPLLASEVERQARSALGDEAFHAAHAVGRSRIEP